ncbi:MAG TPA: hypothetical protein VFU23_08200 [Gemmatimonadales bacterium]|nr:hypothetical protein [Gemmatimonadales bacterium]
MSQTARLVLGVLAAGAIGCQGDMTGSTARARVVLALGPLQNAVTTGDFVTTLETARLTITEGGSTRTVSLTLLPNDSAATFDLSVKQGEVGFSLDVLTNNNTMVYHGAVTSNVTADGFQVDLTPVATAGILVAFPNPVPFDNDGVGLVYDFKVRNAGSTTLTWNADPAFVPAGVTLSCQATPTAAGAPGNCAVTRTLAPAARDDVSVTLRKANQTTPPRPAQGIRLLSSVGSLRASVLP